MTRDVVAEAARLRLDALELPLTRSELVQPADVEVYVVVAAIPVPLADEEHSYEGGMAYDTSRCKKPHPEHVAGSV